MAFLILLAAGLFEVVWVFFMKQSHGFTRLVPSLITLAAMGASLGLLAIAMKSLPLGTAYAVWTGIGTVGAFAMGILLLGESADAMRMIACALIIAGILMMKLSSAA